jgi:hypothetical protein
VASRWEPFDTAFERAESQTSPIASAIDLKREATVRCKKAKGVTVDRE